MPIQHKMNDKGDCVKVYIPCSVNLMYVFEPEFVDNLTWRRKQISKDINELSAFRKTLNHKIPNEKEALKHVSIEIKNLQSDLKALEIWIKFYEFMDGGTQSSYPLELAPKLDHFLAVGALQIHNQTSIYQPRRAKET